MTARKTEDTVDAPRPSTEVGKGEKLVFNPATNRYTVVPDEIVPSLVDGGYKVQD